MFIPSVCGAAAWMAEVNLGREHGHLARGDATRAGRPRSRAVCIGRCAPREWGLT